MNDEIQTHSKKYKICLKDHSNLGTPLPGQDWKISSLYLNLKCQPKITDIG